jgi:glycosyltransferase involved in cell wall biosynthesis
MEATACFLGGARYAQPLDSTNAKKFQALKALGDLYVVGFSYDLSPRRFTEHASFYLLPKFPLPLLRYLEMSTLGLGLALWLIARYGVRILIAQSPYEGFAAAAAKQVAGWFGYKVLLVIESHGDFAASLYLQRHLFLPGVYRFLMCRVARFAFGHADVLRAISHTTREQLQQWVPGKPMYQFPAWTDIEVFLQTDGSAQADVCQYILYAGVLTPLKGVHSLINAFTDIATDFPHTCLVIAGDEANKAYAATLQDQVGRLGLDGRVQFIGKVSQTELAAWMRRACVFVLPSMSEGLGRVVLEAMATGTPVIGSHVGGIPEMVKPGMTGFLVPPGDVAALAKRLRWILAHPAEGYVMGCHASAFAKHFFSTAAYVHGYRQIFAAAQALSTGQRDKHADTPL